MIFTWLSVLNTKEEGTVPPVYLIIVWLIAMKLRDYEKHPVTQFSYTISMFSDGGIDRRPAPETEETNYIEPEPEPVRDREPQPRAQTPDPSPNDSLERNQVVSKEEMCKDCSHYTKTFKKF